MAVNILYTSYFPHIFPYRAVRRVPLRTAAVFLLAAAVAAAVLATAGSYPQKRRAGPTAAVLNTESRPLAGGACAVCPDILEGGDPGVAADRGTALGEDAEFAGTYGPGAGGVQTVSEGSTVFLNGTAAGLDHENRPVPQAVPRRRAGHRPGRPPTHTSFTAPGVIANTAIRLAPNAAGNMVDWHAGGEYDVR